MLAIEEAESKKDQEKLVLNYDYFIADDLQAIAKKIKPSKLVVLTSEKEKCCVLVSDGSVSCGQIIKDASTAYGCRGGGKPNLARAVFDSRENMLRFINSIMIGL